MALRLGDKAHPAVNKQYARFARQYMIRRPYSSDIGAKKRGPKPRPRSYRALVVVTYGLPGLTYFNGNNECAYQIIGRMELLQHLRYGWGNC